jgi:signal transduction histidine kinase
MAVQDEREPDDPGAGRGEQLSSFASQTLALFLAETEEQARSELEAISRRLAEQVSEPVAICELGLSPNGRPLMLWQSTEGGLSVEEDNVFADWLRRASRVGGELTSATRGSWCGVLSADTLSGETGLRMAVMLQSAPANAETIAHAYGIADAAVAAMVRIRKSKASSLERRRFDAMYESTRAWLELGADIVWEASAEGVLRCRRIMNRRGDAGRAVDGMDLKSLHVGGGGRSLLDYLEQEGSVRHLRARLPRDAAVNLPANETVYVSAMRRPASASDEAPYVGTFTLIGEYGPSSHTRETAAMMIQVRGARLREEQQRREAEAMLQGLRLLLGQDSSRDKMAKLVSLILECIGGNEARVAQRGLDGRPRLLVPEQRVLGADADAALDLVAANAPGGLATVYDASADEGRRIAHPFGLEGGHVAVLSLPLRGETAYLICTTNRSEGFAAADIDFADRFTLLLRQALFLREEQSQMAQTAKMAALGQMSASIAHELRQPLNTISLAVQNLEYLLEAPEVDAAAVASKIGRVLAQVERASDVIDRMRRFGRKSVGEHAILPLRTAIENVEAIMHHVLLRAGVRLEVNIPADLTAYADQLQLEQVVSNLIQNAVDAISGIGAKSERDEGLIRIVAARSDEEEGMVQLRIEDSGPGFRSEIMERVLEPFFTTKSADHGTGLGLAICETIVRESGGRLEIGNHDGGGYVAIILPHDAG